MKYLILTLVGLLLGLGGANAGSNMTQVLSTLPDGGYFMDMGINEHGLYSITDLDGNPVPGSPFPVDSSDMPAVGLASVAANETSIKTSDQWGVSIRLLDVRSLLPCQPGSCICSLDIRTPLLTRHVISPNTVCRPE